MEYPEISHRLEKVAEHVSNLREDTATLKERSEAHQRGLDLGRQRTLQFESEVDSRLLSISNRLDTKANLLTEISHSQKNILLEVGRNTDRIKNLEAAREASEREAKESVWRQLQLWSGIAAMITAVVISAGMKIPIDKLLPFVSR